MRRKILFLLILIVLLLALIPYTGIDIKTLLQMGQSTPAQEDNLNDQKDDATDKELTGSQEVVVVIDAGHGGKDKGTNHGEVYEKDLNLDIALKMGHYLKNAGVKIVFTRETDVQVDLKERAEIANRLGAALFVSVHNNSLPGYPEYNGTETLYCTPAKSDPEKLNGKHLAELVQKELVSALKTKDNGIIYRSDLVVLRLTDMPAVIAEIGYVSNKSDRTKLTQESFRDRAAKALVDAVLKALDQMGTNYSGGKTTDVSGNN